MFSLLSRAGAIEVAIEVKRGLSIRAFDANFVGVSETQIEDFRIDVKRTVDGQGYRTHHSAFALQLAQGENIEGNRIAAEAQLVEHG